MSKIVHLVSHCGCFDDHDCQIACGQAGEDMNGSDRPNEVTCKKCLGVHASSERHHEKWLAKRQVAQQVSP